MNVSLKIIASCVCAALWGCDAAGDVGADDADDAFDPCAVELVASGAAPAALELRDVGALEGAGPYGVWSNEPDAACEDVWLAREGLEQPRRVFALFPVDRSPQLHSKISVPSARFPVLIFSHAQNDTTYEQYKNYQELQRWWASWGYVVLSVDDGEANRKKREEGQGAYENIDERIDSIRATLVLARELDAQPGGALEGRLDLDQVVVIGHSRGGGAAWVAAATLDEVDALITLQPVDAQAFGHGAKVIDLPALMMSAGRDDDLKFPHVDGLEALLAGPYTWVDIYKGIHAYTSDTTPERKNDDPGLTRDVQHKIIRYFTTAFLLRHAPPEHAVIDRAALDATLWSNAPTERWAGEPGGELFMRWRPGEQAEILEIDEFDVLSRDDAARADLNALGQRNVSEGLDVSANVFAYAPRELVYSRLDARNHARHLEADEEGRFMLPLAPRGEALEIPADATFEVRVRVEGAAFEGELGAVIELEGGARLEAEATGYMGASGLGARFQQVSVPLGALYQGAGPLRVARVGFEVFDASLIMDEVRLVWPAKR